MSPNQREEKIEEIRAIFLQTEHGRYKLVKEIFSYEELLHSDPLVLIKLIYRRLSLQKNDFNEDSFKRWLKRNRNKLGKQKLQSEKAVNAELPPRNFNFTDPATLTKSKDPLIKFA